MEFIIMEWNILIAIILCAAVFFALGRMSNYNKFLHHDEAPKVSTNEANGNVCPECNAKYPIFLDGSYHCWDCQHEW